jgi:tRNA threonylcarbamoyladenosine biosynthesis protein TsaE
LGEALRDNKVDDERLMLVSHSLADTQRLGALLGQLLKGHEVVCLEGELGTGKTSLIQGIGRGQGIEEPITSPTFTLVNEYRGRETILYHVDLYRLDSKKEMIATGIDAYFYDDGICVIEWAEKAKDILPRECLYITLKHVSEEERSIFLQAKGPSYYQLLHRLKEMLESQQ